MADVPNVNPAAPAPAGGAAPAPAAPAADAREAEYQAAMAKARGEKPTKRDESGRFQPKGETAPEPELDDDAGDAEGDGGEHQAEEGEEAEAETEQEKSWTLKADGKEKVVKSEKDLVALAQKGLAADQRMEKASRIQKGAMQFVEGLRDNPFAVLTNPKLGIDEQALRKAAEKWLYGKVEYESLPQEERDRRTEKAELEKFRERELQAKQEQKAVERAERKAEVTARMTKDFVAVLDSGDVPVTDYTLQRMAGYMRAALKNGHKHIRPADVIDLVNRDFEHTQRQLYQRYDGEKLLGMVGDDAAKKVRKAELARLQKGQEGGNQQGQRAPNPKAPQKKQTGGMPQFSSMEEMRDWNEKHRR